MQAYSMVFLDLDGTLLDSRLQVSENTKVLLGRLEKQGVPVVLCSARSPEGVEMVSKQAGVWGPIICYSGALTLNRERGILAEAGMKAEAAVAFKRFAKENFPQVTVSAYLYNVWLVDDEKDPAIRREAEITQCQPLEGTLERAVQASHVHKLLCIGPQRQVKLLQEQGAAQFPELEFVHSGATYLEVLAAGVSKCSAVQGLQAVYGASRKEIAAFGDYFADLEMLRYAGMGVAMGNAPDAVKKAADFVTATNDQEGVYLALKNMRFAPPHMDNL